MKHAVLALVLSLPLAASCGPAAETEAPPKTDPDLIEMRPEAQKNAGLVVAPARPADLTEYLRVLGTVQPIDSRIGYVRSLARGRVQDVLVRVGDRVERGQPLARLDNIEAGELAAELLAARAELQRLHVQQANAAKQLERSKSLAAIGATAQKDLELAQAEHDAMAEAIRAQESLIAGLDAKRRRFDLAESDLQTSSITTIRSSFPGVVIEVRVAPGAVVDPDVELFSVTDLSEVWVQAEVYEKDLGRIRLGQPARISVDTYPEETFSGTVTYIGDALDPKTRTARVRCVVPNADRRLKLEMLATVDVPTSVSRRALAVPAAAVQQLGDEDVVFVRESEDTFRVRAVTVGVITDGQAEIVSGLSENEPVVAVGAYHLKAVRMLDEIGEG